jgi:hypothetical protein
MAEREFVQIDVGDDGSCFYRAVYGAARYHPSGGILEHFYSCLVGGFGLQNMLGLRNNAARHMAAFVENEDTFVDTIRGYLASAITNTAFLTEFAKRQDPKAVNIYQEYYQLANTDKPLFFRYMAETSAEFQEAFGDPDEFLKLSEEEFKEIYAEILLNRKSYATEAEYQMVQFLLNRCGIQLESVNQADRRSPPKLTLTRNGQPLLFIRRLQQMEHYAYLMDKAVYDANKDMLVGPDHDLRKLSTWRKNRLIYSTSKLAKEAAAAAAKAAKEAAAAAVKAAKPVSKKKGKTRRKSSVNDSAVVAALANMGLTLNTANANLIQSIRNSLK